MTKSGAKLNPSERLLTIKNHCNVKHFSTSCKILIDFLPSYKENIQGKYFQGKFIKKEIRNRTFFMGNVTVPAECAVSYENCRKNEIVNLL